MSEGEKKQRNSWTKQEDQALIYIRQELKVQKWSDVALKLKQMLNLHQRKDKNCRDRYENFLLQSQQRKKPWTQQQDFKLIQLYMQFGNKWCEIAQHFDAISGVYVKNKFYSRMRRGIRTLNFLMDAFFLRNWKKLQIDVVFKLATSASQKYDFDSQNPIVRKLEQNINFIEGKSSLSFVDKMNIEKDPRKSKQNRLTPKEIQQILEEINLIDENTQQKRSNKIKFSSNALQEKKQQKEIEAEAQFKTKLQESNQLGQYRNQLCKCRSQAVQSNNFVDTTSNKKIQIVSTNQFKNKFAFWNRKNLFQQSIADYQKSEERDYLFSSNTKEKYRCGYRLLTNSLDKKSNAKKVEQLKKQQQVQQMHQKQHNIQIMTYQMFPSRSCIYE